MNSQMHSFILLGLFAAGVSQCLANTRWNAANAAYEEGKYEQAKADYIQMVDSREYSAELFYNLGNAWFKLNDQGRAIINYQRALILNPGFEEAKANLQTALKIVGNDDPKTIRDSLGCKKAPPILRFAALVQLLLEFWLLRAWQFRSGSARDPRTQIALWLSNRQRT
jgi:tetratricopeptide (TPR) repeat protein